VISNTFQAGEIQLSERAALESNSARHCIQSGNEIAVASDTFNGTLLTSFSLLYEYAL
jgi:hypothetical protein